MISKTIGDIVYAAKRELWSDASCIDDGPSDLRYRMQYALPVAGRPPLKLASMGELALVFAEIKDHGYDF